MSDKDHAQNVADALDLKDQARKISSVERKIDSLAEMVQKNMALTDGGNNANDLSATNAFAKAAGLDKKPIVLFDSPQQRSLYETKERHYDRALREQVRQNLLNRNTYEYAAGTLSSQWDVNGYSNERISHLGAMEDSFDRLSKKVNSTSLRAQIGKHIPLIIFAVVVLGVSVTFLVEFLQPADLHSVEAYLSNPRQQYAFLIGLFAVGLVIVSSVFLTIRRKEKKEES